ncbi:MAG: transposase [Gammaproteobacteria bacterium]|nr:transposase [Gammaproteobacteria bacterium]
MDDYAGYNAVAATKDITQLGCWAHARRKFIDTQKIAAGTTKQTIKPPAKWAKPTWPSAASAKPLPTWTKLAKTHHLHTRRPAFD